MTSASCHPGGSAATDAASTAESQFTGHRVDVPGGCLYYRTQGTGPELVLIGGGPANADTLGPLARRLADDHTVITYDRRGYSRSHLDDPAEHIGISRHGDDLRLLIAALGTNPVSVFGTSFGALIALDLAASAPGSIDTVIVHEPPLGQMLADGLPGQSGLDLHSDRDARAELNAIAELIEITRSLAAGARPEINHADFELFIRRDVPAIGAYHLDLNRLDAVSGQLIVTGSKDGRSFYPYQCALRLAQYLQTPLIELPGNHADIIQQPSEFAAALKNLHYLALSVGLSI